MNSLVDLPLSPSDIISQRKISDGDGVEVLELFARGYHPELKSFGPVHFEENGWSGGPETRVKITLGLPPEVFLG